MRWDWMKMAAISECLAQAGFPLDVFELKAAQSKVRASPACPGHDYDDLMSGVDAVIAKGYIDPSQLFVTGGSGLLGSCLIARLHAAGAEVTCLLREGSKQPPPPGVRPGPWRPRLRRPGGRPGICLKPCSTGKTD